MLGLENDILNETWPGIDGPERVGVEHIPLCVRIRCSSSSSGVGELIVCDGATMAFRKRRNARTLLAYAVAEEMEGERGWVSSGLCKAATGLAIRASST